METIKKFKKGNVYIGRFKGFGAWYVIHQEGQRTWTATNFTHINIETEGDDVIRNNSTMAESFEKIQSFDKTNVEDRKNMREVMFKILKWGDPEADNESENDEEYDEEYNVHWG